MAPAPDKPSEIAAIWEDACRTFEKESGASNEFAAISTKSPAEIKSTLYFELDKLKSRRHDGGKIDAIRKSIGKHLDIIHGVASIASQLGKAAFPPTEAIFAAFTLVIRASKAVSEDLDKMERFFQVMGLFAERLGILGNRLPDVPNETYRQILMRVFASMLRVSTVVVKSMSSHRATKFTKSLVRQSGDPELEEAVKELQENVRSFEDATVTAVLAVGVETQRELRGMHDTLDLTFAMTRESRQISHAMRALSVIKTRLNKGGALAKNQRVLCDSYQREIAPRTLEWLFEEEQLQRTAPNDPPSLWISGDAGLGKTVIAASIVKRLNQELSAKLGSPESSQTSVAYFFFHQEYDQPKSSIESMILSCAVQLAEADKDYRMAIAPFIKDIPSLDDWQISWKDLFLDIFPKESPKSLILVLDGLDSYDATYAEESSKELPGVFGKLLERTKDLEARIQIIFTSSNPFFSDQETNSISQGHLWIDKKKMQSDMYRIARHAIKSSSRLKGLGAKLRKKIARFLRDKADNIRYIEHMVRRLNAIGRESKVEAELRALPQDSTKLHELILYDCGKDRSDKELQYLRRLYAWLAYSKKPLSLGAVTKLSEVISGSFDLDAKFEDEVDRSSGILRLLTQPYNESDEETASGSDEASEENNKDGITGNAEERITYKHENSESLVLFQERSLRSFLRRPSDDPHPSDLRSSISAANRMILDDITENLTQLSWKDHHVSDPTLSFWNDSELLDYAADNWLAHLCDINIDTLEANECVSLASNLYKLLSAPQALLNLEFKSYAWRRRWWDRETPSIIHEDAPTALSRLSQRAAQLDPSLFSSDMFLWVELLAEHPEMFHLLVAKGHVRNWLSGPWDLDHYWAAASFRAAYVALYNGKASLQNTELQEYMGMSQTSDMIFRLNQFNPMEPAFTETDVTLMAEIFSDPCKSKTKLLLAQAALITSRDLKMDSVYEFSRALAQAALELGASNTSNLERLRMAHWASRSLISLADSTEKHASTTADDSISVLDQSRLKITEASELLAEVSALCQREETRDEDYAKALEAELVNGVELRIKLEVLLGNIDKAITLFPAAKFCIEFDSFLFGYGGEITELLADKGHWEAIMHLLLSINPKTRKEQLTFNALFLDGLCQFEKAAKLTNQTHEVDGIYAEPGSVSSISRWVNNLDVTLCRALFQQRVVGDLPKARELAKQFLDEGGNPQSVQKMLASNLTEQFRHSKDPDEKDALFKDLKNLLNRLSLLGVDGVEEYDVDASHLGVPLALMARKLGPAKVYHNYLNKTFLSCVKALTDSKAWNDSSSLVTLAKILMCVPGFSEEASVASSCQFYILDRKVYNDENKPSGSNQNEGNQNEDDQKEDNKNEDNKNEERESETNPDTASPSHNTATGSSADDNNSHAHSAEKIPESAANSSSTEATTTTTENTEDTAAATDQITKDVDEDRDVQCDAGSEYCRIWNGRAVYLCVYCVDINLCQTCYEDKIAREEANNPDWRTVCFKGHPFIKAPAEGWRGVEDGVLFLKDNKEIKFRDWLEELQKKWDLAWDRFWLDESLL
ncbi:hypothetical protein B0T19DRAFT_472661 [Cercophora scortea]|uniref:NACHT domain-containing protein n=1 Tax=Cercophora scortea TaxID=314031 RepID=A0AAE0IUP8_9PEZI|nr:hypothetical protein B0T19DRAFT_472661 [Cercophora scortea]